MKILYSRHMYEVKQGEVDLTDGEYILGVVGEKTDMTYDDGTNMHLGDVVEIVDPNGNTLGFECVVEDWDGAFVMGLKAIGENIKDGCVDIGSMNPFAGDSIVKILKHKNYEEVEVGKLYGGTVVMEKEYD